MDNFIEVLSKFDGIVGTLLGVALTFVLTDYIKRMGKLQFFITEKCVKFKIKQKSSYGETIYEETTDKREANFFEVELFVEIYNSSDTQNILRDVKFSLYSNNQRKLSVTPRDNSVVRPSPVYFRHANIKPKEIISLNLVYYFRKEEVEVIKGCDKVFLEARGSDRKLHKVLVAAI